MFDEFCCLLPDLERLKDSPNVSMRGAKCLTLLRRRACKTVDLLLPPLVPPKFFAQVSGMSSPVVEERAIRLAKARVEATTCDLDCPFVGPLTIRLNECSKELTTESHTVDVTVAEIIASS